MTPRQPLRLQPRGLWAVPLEHLVIAGVVVIIAAAHDTERRGHGALAWGEDRAHQQQLNLPPGWAGEQRREGNKNRSNRVGQGEHRLAFFDGVRPAYPVLIIYLAFVQSPAWG